MKINLEILLNKNQIIFNCIKIPLNYFLYKILKYKSVANILIKNLNFDNFLLP